MMVGRGRAGVAVAVVLVILLHEVRAEVSWNYLSGMRTRGSSQVNGNRSPQRNQPGPNWYPNARSGSTSWVKNTHLYIFGGNIVSTGLPVLSDLWRFDFVSGNWTWLTGSNGPVSISNYDNFGSPSPNNVISARSGASGFQLDAFPDSLFLFGGILGSNIYADVWRYDISVNQWAWVAGNQTYGVPIRPSYGDMDVPGSGYPGSRGLFATWSSPVYPDSFWLYGGLAWKPNYANDLWRFSFSTMEWTWLLGSNRTDVPVNYTGGDMGGRHNVGVVVSGEVAYLYGGDFYNSLEAGDLWRFNMTDNEMVFLAGCQNSCDPIYGTMGVEDPTVMPGLRRQMGMWWANTEHTAFYIAMGIATNDHLGDIFRYNVTSGLFVWVAGTNDYPYFDGTGVYGPAKQVSPVTVPGPRASAVWANPRRLNLTAVPWTAQYEVFVFGGDVQEVLNNVPSSGPFNDFLAMVTCHPQCPGNGTCFASGMDSCADCAGGCYKCRAGEASLCTGCASTSDYITADHTCMPCDLSCATCNGAGPSACTSCQASTPFLSGGTCKGCNAACSNCTGPQATECTSCHPGYYFISGACLPCHGACQQCSGPDAEDCLSCGSGGFYADPNVNTSVVCLPCNQSCVTCSGPGEYACTGCAAPTPYLAFGQCVGCHVSCGSCFGPLTSQCLTCARGSRAVLNGGTCEQCDNNCDTCGGSTTNCTGCTSDRFLNGTRCKNCIYPCDSCSGPDYCLSCANSLTLGDNGQCLGHVCADSCVTCTGPGASECTSCVAGHYLEGSSCYACVLDDCAGQIVINNPPTPTSNSGFVTAVVILSVFLAIAIVVIVLALLRRARKKRAKARATAHADLPDQPNSHSTGERLSSDPMFDSFNLAEGRGKQGYTSMFPSDAPSMMYTERGPGQNGIVIAPSASTDGQNSNRASVGGASTHSVATVLVDTRAVKIVQMDDLEILGELGRGSFGRVLHVRERSTYTEMALKVFTSVQSTPQVVSDFVKEASELSNMHHLHCLSCFGLLINGNELGVLTEYMPGGDLERAMTRLSPQQKIKALAGAAKGLAYIHSRERTHCDIKPSNVLLDATSEAKLGDFGFTGMHPDRAFTERFAAPEVLLGAPPHPRSDVFALGVLIAYVMTGIPPFSFLAAKERRQDGDIFAPSHQQLEASITHPALVALISACQHRDPARRPTAAEVIPRLLECMPREAPALL